LGFLRAKKNRMNGRFNGLLLRQLLFPTPNIHYSINSHCALYFYLYRIDCKPSPFCECHWGITETLSHYFLHCPLYAAQRQILFSLSARLLPTIWSSLSESQKVHLFLHGSDKLGYADNQMLLHNVQLFILNSKRFTNCVHDS
jgi:hypothetical protein